MVLKRFVKRSKHYDSEEERVVGQSLLNHNTMQEVGGFMLEAPVMVGELLVKFVVVL